ncbi:DUF11 domain-containing protein [Sphingomonas montana]|uniref:DUF11 domain-containing protein n=1 Tax=Sphingomonas montana TaxID=1843236 RepID=UPI0009F898E1|nr:DUF11 domain-containing protein [Sphingomonas montana]
MPIIPRLLRLCMALLFAIGVPGHAQPGVRVSNMATLSYVRGTETRTLTSNIVTLDVLRTRVPTTLSFRLPAVDRPLAAAICDAGGATLMAAPIDAATLAAAARLQTIDMLSPYIVVLDAPAENRDPATRETATIAVQTGTQNRTMRLTETAADSGVFAGGVPAAGGDPARVPCAPVPGRGDPATFRFVETSASGGSAIDLTIDPAGYVFDSRSGVPVDGATVALVDAQGAAATVFGDDGVSAYPATVVSGAAVTDASGRVYPGVPGRYRFPRSPAGTYRLRITPPGAYRAPSTVDRALLAQVRDPAGAPYVLNPASFGETLVLAGSAPVFADIPVDRDAGGTLLLTKLASVRQASPGDFVQYRLQLTNRGDAPAAGVRVTDTLPPGLRYEVGSTRGAPEPSLSADGRNLTFAIPTLAPATSADLRYVVTIAPGAPVGEALNRARATGDGGVGSNEAAASVRVQALLFTDAMTIIGRVTEGACNDPASGRRGVAGIRLLMEDGTFVLTDRDGLYHFEGVRAGRHVVQIDRAGLPATHEPVACDVDTRQAGSAISRFVEGTGGLLKRVDFQLRPTGKAAAAVDALPVPIADDATAAGVRDWMTGQAAGIDWLFPAIDHNPRAPALRVVIKHGPTQRVALTLNGAQVDPLSFDGTDRDEARGLAISRWTGLSLAAGDTRLVARVLEKDGSVAKTLERTVHYAGAPAKAVYDPAVSRLVADGMTRPLIAVRVTDATGRAVRAGTAVPFRVDPPYVAAVDVALEQGRRQTSGQASGQPTETVAHVVGDAGLAFIALQPTTQAGAARVTVTLTEDRTVRTSDVRAWLAASAREWVVVGFGSGSAGYDMLKRRAAALPRGDRNAVVTDGQLAFYAKGRVKGSWLMTIAYDSDRTYDPDRGLLGTIDPDRYYTVYGDGAQQGYDAATRRKLYLRLERREFYALFGDFESGFTDTQLTRYSRTLNGVKAAYEGQRIRATGFAAKTDTLYTRDEIRGNGLSGPYRLSGRRIVPNSDKLRIETRDRFRSERILASEALTRHIDYDIDTTLGTIRFRRPILGRDASLNPIFIMVDYEIEGARGAKLAAAGRVSTRLADGKVELGASMIRDEAIGVATVAGVDAKARLGTGTEVRGEYAQGGRGGLDRGRAFLAEAEHHSPRVDALGYVRQQDDAFGVGQQNLVEAGTRKFGFDGRLGLSDRLSLTGIGWNQTQLTGAGSRTAGEARLEYRRATGTVFVGGQIAMDRGTDGRNRDSRLLTLGGSQALFGDKLVLTGQTQMAPGGSKDSVDFPIRHQILAAYRIRPGIRLIGGYEIADGADYAAHTTQAGFDVTPWKGAKLMATANQQAIGENGARTYAQYGLNQSLPLGKHWTVDATLDASSTIRGRVPDGAVINAFQPVASAGVPGGGSVVGGVASPGQGGGDYTAVTLGAAFRANRWSWTGRVEYRDADENQRLGLTSSVLRLLGQGRTLASGIKAYRVRDRSGAIASYAAVDVALALRPLDSRWSLLERLELRTERADGAFSDDNDLGVPAYGGGDQVTTRVINNLAVNYRTGAEGRGHGFEGTLYHGAKYVRGRFARDAYDGLIQVVGFELRKDLGPRFDIGIQGSAQHAWTRSALAFSGGPTVGVSPVSDMWVSAGYNVQGYRDRDFEADRYTRQGPYVTMRMKFDQTGLSALAGRLAGAGR